MTITQDFDLVHEMNDTIRLTEFKHRMPSLDELDHDGYDGEDADILLGLVRWGDRFVPA